MNIDEWFTIEQFGYVRPKLTDVETLDAAKGAVNETYPHMVEMSVKSAPIVANFVFDEVKRPWTSFFSRVDKLVIFAFSDVKDAVEFRLKVEG